jgi:hypothetical protein
MNLTEQMKKEVVKAFAYGKKPDEVADVAGISEAEAIEYRDKYEDNILKKMVDLKEEGYIE